MCIRDRAGTVIAKTGNSAGLNTGACHLHFEILLAPSGLGKWFSRAPNSTEGGPPTFERMGWVTDEDQLYGMILNNPAVTNAAGFPEGRPVALEALSAQMCIRDRSPCAGNSRQSLNIKASRRLPPGRLREAFSLSSPFVRSCSLQLPLCFYGRYSERNRSVQTAVSYTHLDVYKRQSQHNGEQLRQRFGRNQCDSIPGKTMLRPIQTVKIRFHSGKRLHPWIKAFIADRHTAIPVSYTHLSYRQAAPR